MIPFLKPYVTGYELHSIAKTYIESDLGERGHKAVSCEQELGCLYGSTKKVALTSSIGSAYELLADILKIAATDDILLPSLIHSAAANAFVKRGANLIYYDFRSNGYSPGIADIEKKITPKVKLVVLSHFLGVIEDYSELCQGLRLRSVFTVEDLSHAFACELPGRNAFTGTYSDFAAASFYEDQWIHCGEGGALFVSPPRFHDVLDTCRYRGTNKSYFLSDARPHYDWLEAGGEYSLNELPAAFLLPQLERRSEVFELSKSIFKTYLSAVANYDRECVLKVPTLNYKGKMCAPHAFFIELPNMAIRDSVLSGFRRVGIDCRPYLEPLHRTTFGSRYRNLNGDSILSRAENLSDRTVRLPFHSGIEVRDQERIVKLLIRLVDNCT